MWVKISFARGDTGGCKKTYKMHNLQTNPLQPPFTKGGLVDSKRGTKGIWNGEKNIQKKFLHKSMKIFHPPLIPPIKGGKVPSPLVGEGLGEGYFRINTLQQQAKNDA